TVDDTKFHLTLNILPAEYLETIMYILRNLPPTGKYEAIKAKIIDEHQPSTQAQFAQLFRALELGDSKPSVLLRRMRDLARGGMGEDALKAMWLERLPEGLRLVVAMAQGELDNLAIMADRTWEYAHPTLNAVSATAPTTPYHPQSNGIIERFHRTLKAALKCHNTTDWYNRVPIVLLGLRATLKTDINASPAEMLYGTTIRLPGDLFESTRIEDCNSYFVKNLRNIMTQLQPLQTSDHATTRTSFVHKHLQTSSHVFIRDDTVRSPLKAPYDGPYPVLHREDKFFDVEVKGKRLRVSIDRLKPAHLPDDRAIGED
ncbi:hypothetical protein KR084_008388, partial [Drosophila pseudotakahashii]